MDAIGEFLSWKYIVGVLVAGLLINIGSHYLIPRLDSFLSSISFKWRTQSEKMEKEHEDLLDKYERDPLLVFLLVHGQISAAVLVLICMILAVICLVIGSSVSLADGEIFKSAKQLKLLGTVFIFLGFCFYFVTMDKMVIFRDLRKRRLAAAQNTEQGEK